MQDFSILIQNWYRQNARDLPWRRTNDPYFIWLSEIILQQTRVDQGTDYYLKFAKHYPDIHALASASEDEVLNDWQGLGYYSRARNLHAAAKYISSELKGDFPNTYKSVLELKGVGPYTAAAICSFAYQLPLAVVDGNVYRVISRYLGISTPIDSTAGKKEFNEAANILLDKTNPGDHNQAIMELGALVCTPKNPDCSNCPVSDTCYAFENKSQLAYPVKEKKTKVRDRFLNYLVVKKDDHVFIKKRGDNDVWKGLYDFPLIESNSKDENIDQLAGSEGFLPDFIDKEFKHILSHQRIHAKFWISNIKEGLDHSDRYILVPIEQLEDYPMPQLLIRYLEASGHFIRD